MLIVSLPPDFGHYSRPQPGFLDLPPDFDVFSRPCKRLGVYHLPVLDSPGFGREIQSN